jgi:hypothetical protein
MSFRSKTKSKKKSGGSVVSYHSSKTKKPFVPKEEQIGKRIEDLLRAKETRIYK